MVDTVPMMNMWAVTGFVSSTNRITYCNSDTWLYLGGPGLLTSAGSMSRLYSGFSTHSVIYFNIALALGGIWQGTDYFSIKFDDRGPFSFSPGSAVQNKAGTYCAGVSTLETNIVGKILHSASTVTVYIAWSFPGTGSPSPSIGIKDISMSFGTKKADDTEGVYLSLGDTGVSGSTICPVGRYFDTSSNYCQYCNSICWNCFGPSAAQCYRPPWNGYYDGAIAYNAANTPYCSSASGLGTSQCNWCADNYALNPDGSCSTSCPSPYVKYGDNLFHICLMPCSSSQYMAWNNSCIDTCNSALISGTDSHGKTCSYPCGRSPYTYLYWDGSCRTTCTYYPRVENYYQFCDVCQRGYYKYDNGSCLTSCEASFTLKNIGDSLFCTFPCSDTNLYAYANSSCFSTCQPLFKIITSGVYKFCNYPCSSSQYLYANGSCLATCQALFIPRMEGSNQFCDYPCATGYLYANGSCLATCQSVFIPRTEGTNKFCDYPCTSGYLYANGSCLATCQALFIPRTEGTNKFCDYPCATGYLYANGSCLATCQSLFVQRTEGSYKFCTYPCASNQYLYQNGSCLLTCQTLFIPRTEGTYQFCASPCPIGQYLYANSTCATTCAAVQRIESIHKFCDFPCTSSQFLYQNDLCLDTCDTPFVRRTEGVQKFCSFSCDLSQFLYQNNSCIASCKIPFKLNAKGIYKYCNTICQDLTYYYYPDKDACDLNCESPYKIVSQGLCELPEVESSVSAAVVSTSEAINDFRKTVSSNAVLATLLSSFDPSSFFTASLCKTPYYTRNMNLQYSNTLKEVFKRQQPDELSPKGFSTLQNILKEKMNDARLLTETSGIYSTNSNFLVNFLPALISLLIVLSIGLYAWIIRVFIKNKASFASRIFDKILETIKWNFFFAFSLYYYDGLIYYTSLELRAHHTSKTGSIISIIVCGIVNLGVFLMLGQAIRVVLRRRNQAKRIHAKNFSDNIAALNEKDKSYKVIYESFKDNDLIQQGFYVIYSIRVYLYFVFLSYLYDYPIFQASLMFILNIASLACLIIKRPLKTTLKLIQYTVQEGILLVISVLVLITAWLGSRGSFSESSKESIGNTIVAFYMILLIFSTFIVVVQVIAYLRDLYRYIKGQSSMKNAQTQEVRKRAESSESSPLGNNDHGIEHEQSPKVLPIDSADSNPITPLKIYTEDPILVSSPSPIGQKDEINLIGSSNVPALSIVVIPQSNQDHTDQNIETLNKKSLNRENSRRLAASKRLTKSTKLPANQEELVEEVV